MQFQCETRRGFAFVCLYTCGGKRDFGDEDIGDERSDYLYYVVSVWVLRENN